MRKCGMSMYQIAERLDRPYGTIRHWLVRAHEHGLADRFDIKHGAPCRLDSGQLQLREDLTAGPRSCGLGCDVDGSAGHPPRQKKFGITYANTSMYDLLHKLGFSCRKPRTSLPLRRRCQSGS